MVENQVVLLSWEMRFFAQVFVYVTPLLHEFLMDFAFFPRNQFMILTFFLSFEIIFHSPSSPLSPPRQLNERKMSEIYCVILLKYLNLILDLAEDLARAA
jgi:hypothetical protein